MPHNSRGHFKSEPGTPLPLARAIVAQQYRNAGRQGDKKTNKMPLFIDGLDVSLSQKGENTEEIKREGNGRNRCQIKHNVSLGLRK